jgi:mannitol/fructose-specific phosphotransferase system IIA component (Ntr-type)
LAKSSDFAFTGVVAPPQDTSLLKAFSRAMSLLSDSPNVRDVIPETDAEQALHNIEQDLRSRTSSSPNVT